MLKRLASLSKYLITVIFLAVTFYTVDLSWREWSQLLAEYNIDFRYIAAALLGMTFIVAVNSWKWQIAMKAQNLRPDYLRVFYHYFAGYFFNAFITGTGDIKRAIDLGREQKNFPGVMASVIADRWSGVVGQLSLGLITLLLAFRRDSALGEILAASLLLVAGMFLAFFCIASLKAPETDKISGSFVKYLWKVQKSFAAYRNNRLFLVSGLLLGFVGPLTLVIVHYFLVKALGLQLSLSGLFFYIPTVSIFAQLPITVNGFGLQDYFMVQFLSGSLTPAGALTLSIAFHAVRLGIGIIGGLFYIAFPRLGKTEVSEG